MSDGLRELMDSDFYNCSIKNIPTACLTLSCKLRLMCFDVASKLLLGLSSGQMVAPLYAVGCCCRNKSNPPSLARVLAPPATLVN